MVALIILLAYSSVVSANNHLNDAGEVSTDSAPKRLSADEIDHLKKEGANDADIALINAVQSARGKSIGGVYDPKLCKIAENYAKMMIRDRRLSHNGFDDRFEEAIRVTGMKWVAENGAASYEVYNFRSRQNPPSLQDHAKECATNQWVNRSREYRTKHEKTMRGTYDRWCYKMVEADYTVLGKGKPYICVGMYAHKGVP